MRCPADLPLNFGAGSAHSVPNAMTLTLPALPSNPSAFLLPQAVGLANVDPNLSRHSAKRLTRHHFRNEAAYIGIVYSYLPFMILPLYANLEKMDVTLLEAAADLGCRPWQAFYKITLPLSMPGIVAGCLLVFIPAVGEFVIPSLLGDPGMLMIGRVLWTEFFNNRDWPVSAAVAIALLLFLVIPIMYYQRAQDAEAGGGLHR